jgi:hypothetical protein
MSSHWEGQLQALVMLTRVVPVTRRFEFGAISIDKFERPTYRFVQAGYIRDVANPPRCKKTL